MLSMVVGEVPSRDTSLAELFLFLLRTVQGSHGVHKNGKETEEDTFQDVSQSTVGQ